MSFESTESMKRLVEEASRVEFIPGGALKIYFRSANSLLRQAKRYKEENDLIKAYKLYMRYATYALTEIQNMKPILDDYFRQLEAEASKGEHAIDHSKVLKTSEHYNRMQRQQQLKQEEQQQINLRPIDDRAIPLPVNDKTVSPSINDRAVPLPINNKTDIGAYKNHPNWDLINELKDIVPADSL
ncbi:10287_t:CDS:2 [Entrophospora sp. SA101]|nr:10287_t:CDS:2 [Entrophospora sp. SA101]